MEGQPAETPIASPAEPHGARDVECFAAPSGPDLVSRTADFGAWLEARRRTDSWPHDTLLEGPATTVAEVVDWRGTRHGGINFVSQDALSLTSHPLVQEAATRALREFGSHAAGTPGRFGETRITSELQEELGALLEGQPALLFPSGWAAGFGSVVGLLRAGDHVIVDAHARPALQRGAAASGAAVVRTPHLDVASVYEHLNRIRRGDHEHGILVVTEALFESRSDVPRLAELQGLCDEFGASLLVDLSLDLASRGPAGTGELGAQGLLGRVDFAVGSLSVALAAPGGFLVCRDRGAREFVRWFGETLSNASALSPVTCATALEALRIARSGEGDHLRERLRENARALRAALAAGGIDCPGVPSVVVPVPAGPDDEARRVVTRARRQGVIAHLVERPVPDTPRIQMNVMAYHAQSQATEAGRIVAAAIRAGRPQPAAA